jgi:hypothetical protein
VRRPEIRRPEIRRKSEARNPKSETGGAGGAPAFRAFGFRVSGFGFPGPVPSIIGVCWHGGPRGSRGLDQQRGRGVEQMDGQQPVPETLLEEPGGGVFGKLVEAAAACAVKHTPGRDGSGSGGLGESSAHHGVPRLLHRRIRRANDHDDGVPVPGIDFGLHRVCCDTVNGNRTCLTQSGGSSLKRGWKSQSVFSRAGVCAMAGWALSQGLMRGGGKGRIRRADIVPALAQRTDDRPRNVLVEQ